MHTLCSPAHTGAGWGRTGGAGVGQLELRGPRNQGLLVARCWVRICGEERSQRGTEVRDSVSQWGRIWRIPLYQDPGKREPALSHFSFEDKLVFLLNGS